MRTKQRKTKNQIAVGIVAFLMAFVMLAPFAGRLTYADTDRTAVPVTVNGKTELVITPIDGAPAPDQTRVVIEKQGEIWLPLTTTPEAKYQVAQVESESQVQYDKTVWLVRIYYTVEGGLPKHIVVASKDNSEFKPAEINFANTYPLEPVVVDPPLKKRVVGDKPQKAGTFTFAMKAVSNTAGYEIADMPMPEGSENGVKRKTVIGPGEYEFGNFTISKEGTYTYALVEEKLDEKGYTYDDTRYTIEWVVTAENGKLVAAAEIRNQDDKKSNACEFTNTYKDDPQAVPKTGDGSGLMLWMAMCCGAFVFLVVLMKWKHR